MPLNWNTAAQAAGEDYTTDDFKKALYQLVCEQCLYARFSHQSVAYRLVARFRNDFKDAADLMGLKLSFNDRLEYCCVTQDVARHAPMGLQESMFLLVLRHAYHVHASAGDATIEGDVVIELPELEELHNRLTGRQLDMRRGALMPLVKMAQRQGLARECPPPDGDPQPFAVQILPGIADVLSEHALNRFGAHMKSVLMTADDAESIPESGPSLGDVIVKENIQ